MCAVRGFPSRLNSNHCVFSFPVEQPSSLTPGVLRCWRGRWRQKGEAGQAHSKQSGKGLRPAGKRGCFRVSAGETGGISL